MIQDMGFGDLQNPSSNPNSSRPASCIFCTQASSDACASLVPGSQATVGNWVITPELTWHNDTPQLAGSRPGLQWEAASPPCPTRRLHRVRNSSGTQGHRLPRLCWPPAPCHTTGRPWKEPWAPSSLCSEPLCILCPLPGAVHILCAWLPPAQPARSAQLPARETSSGDSPPSTRTWVNIESCGETPLLWGSLRAGTTSCASF